MSVKRKKKLERKKLHSKHQKEISELKKEHEEEQNGRIRWAAEIGFQLGVDYGESLMRHKQTSHVDYITGETTYEMDQETINFINMVRGNE